MQSVEHLLGLEQIKQEQKSFLKERLKFEEYQADFDFNESELEHATILDVGTEEGNFVHYLQKVKNNPNAFGIDFNQETIPEDCPYLNIGNIQSLPYHDKLFDIVVSRNVLHGIFLSNEKTESSTQALSELIRITKDGGIVEYAIKSPDHIRNGIMRDIQDENMKKTLIKRLQDHIQQEAKFLLYLQSLGHRVIVTFRNGRRIVKIEKRAVQ